MTTEETTRQRALAIELHLAGTPIKDIADQLGVAVMVARKLVKDALDERVATEIARIDAMIAGLWARARRGDEATPSTAWPSSRSAGPSSSPPGSTHQMRKAFDQTVGLSKDIKDVDAGAVQLGREYATASTRPSPPPRARSSPRPCTSARTSSASSGAAGHPSSPRRRRQGRRGQRRRQAQAPACRRRQGSAAADVTRQPARGE
jgi:hypothetical protein